MHQVEGWGTSQPSVHSRLAMEDDSERRSGPWSTPRAGTDVDVLVVDDDDVLRSTWAQIIGGAGYSVATADDGDEALLTLSERTVGIVLLDLRMPRSRRPVGARRPHGPTVGGTRLCVLPRRCHQGPGRSKGGHLSRKTCASRTPPEHISDRSRTLCHIGKRESGTDGFEPRGSVALAQRSQTPGGEVNQEGEHVAFGDTPYGG